jgi:hypothetical protein
LRRLLLPELRLKKGRTNVRLFPIKKRGSSLLELPESRRDPLLIWFGGIPWHVDPLAARDSKGGMSLRNISQRVDTEGVVHITPIKWGWSQRLDAKAIVERFKATH